jgi:hypothetical protein
MVGNGRSFSSVRPIAQLGRFGDLVGNAHLESGSCSSKLLSQLRVPDRSLKRLLVLQLRNLGVFKSPAGVRKFEAKDTHDADFGLGLMMKWAGRIFFPLSFIALSAERRLVVQ